MTDQWTQVETDLPGETQIVMCKRADGFEELGYRFEGEFVRDSDGYKIESPVVAWKPYYLING